MRSQPEWASAGRTMFSQVAFMWGRLELKERGAPERSEAPGRLATETVPKIKRARIRCPHCQWQPSRGSRWMCASSGVPENYDRGCGHVWNTFDTRGLCPGCKHPWKYTACLSCTRWSLHEDWYEKEPGKGPV